MRRAFSAYWLLTLAGSFAALAIACGGGGGNGDDDGSGDGGSGGGSTTSPAVGGTLPSGSTTGQTGGVVTGPWNGGAEPSPGSGGADPAQVVRGDIQFSVPAGIFQGNVEVALSSGAGGEIHYTLDGQVPSPSSPVYSAPLQLEATTEIRAQAFDGSQPVGEPGSAVYVARSFDATLDLPLVVLDNYGQGPVVDENSFSQPASADRPVVSGAFLVYGLENGAASFANAPEVATRAAFHVRGQSSATFPKTPYHVELRGNDDDDADWPMLGMPAESDWALRPCYSDKSLIRDAFFYGLGRDMGMASPRFAFVEFFLNTDDRPLAPEDYMGVYLFLETIKNAKNRLDLAQLRPADTTLPALTGGYIFKFEWKAAEEPTLLCAGATSSTSSTGVGFGFGSSQGNTNGCWQDLEVADPSPLGPEQETWLTQYVQAFHDALHADTFTDPVAGYAPMIDVGSFVDQLIINELGRELDSYIRSAYFYKDRDGLLTAGPLWDYDLTFGVGGDWEGTMGFGNLSPEGWAFVDNSQDRTPIANDWFLRLTEDPAFAQRLVTRWRELRQGLLSDAQLEARVVALSTPLVNAAQRNFERWPILDQASVEMFTTTATDTWEEQLLVLREWMTARVAWMDSQLL